MDELVQQVAQRTSLSEEASREAVEAVIAILKEKLPEPLASQLEGLITGSGSMDDLGGLTQGLGGLFGG